MIKSSGGVCLNPVLAAEEVEHATDDGYHDKDNIEQGIAGALEGQRNIHSPDTG